MTTYLLLNLIFLGTVIAVLGVFYLYKKIKPPYRLIAVTVGIILIFTAIFDPLAVGLGIFTYEQSKILGITIGEAPIEDLFYALLAGILIPSIWHIGDTVHAQKK